MEYKSLIENNFNNVSSNLIQNLKAEVALEKDDFTHDVSTTYGQVYNKAKFLSESAKYIYYKADDPRKEAYKDILADVFSENFGNVNKKYIKANFGNIIKQSTGYDLEADSVYEIFRDKTVEGFSNLWNAALPVFSFALKNQGADVYSEEYKEDTNKLNKRLSKAIKNRRIDYYKEFDNLSDDLLMNTASFLPSMAPSIALSGLGYLLAPVTGGASAVVGKALSSIWAGVSEASNLALDLYQRGADPDTISKFATTYGVIAGLLERTGDIAESKVLKPMEQVIALHSSVAKKMGKDTIAKTAGEFFGKMMLHSINSELTEPLEEVLQDFASNVVTNLANEYQRQYGREFCEGKPYTIEDMKQSARDTALATVKGNILPLGATNALSTVMSYTGGDLSYINNAKKFADYKEGMDVIRTQAVKFVGDIKEYKPKSGEKVGAVKATQIGNNFYVSGEDASKAQYIIKNSNKDGSGMYVTLQEQADTSTLEHTTPEQANKLMSETYSTSSLIDKDGKMTVDYGIDKNGNIQVSDKKQLGKVVDALARNKEVTGINQKDENTYELVLGDKKLEVSTDFDSVTQKFSDLEEAKAKSKTTQTLVKELQKSKEEVLSAKAKTREQQHNAYIKSIEEFVSQEKEEDRDKVRESIREADSKIFEAVAKSVGKGAGKLKKIEAYTQAATSMAMRMSRSLGMSIDDFMNKIEFGIIDDAQFKAEGSTTLGKITSKGGKYKIELSKHMNATTLSHELAHAYLFNVGENFDKIENFSEIYKDQLKNDGGKIGEETQEAFAKDFEKYLMSGVAENEGLRGIFEQLKQAIKSCIECLGNVLDEKTKQMFDNILNGKTQVEGSETQDSATFKQDIGELSAIKAFLNGDSYVDKYKVAKFFIDKSPEQATVDDIIYLDEKIKDIKPERTYNNFRRIAGDGLLSANLASYLRKLLQRQSYAERISETIDYITSYAYVGEALGIQGAMGESQTLRQTSTTEQELNEKLKAGGFPNIEEADKFFNSKEMIIEDNIREMFFKDKRSVDELVAVRKQYLQDSELKTAELTDKDLERIFDKWKNKLAHQGIGLTYDGDKAYYVSRILAYNHEMNNAKSSEEWFSRFEGTRASENVKSLVNALVKQKVITNDGNSTKFPYLSQIAYRMNKSGSRSYIEAELTREAINEIRENKDFMQEQQLRADNKEATADFNLTEVQDEEQYKDINRPSDILHDKDIPLEMKNAVRDYLDGGSESILEGMAQKYKDLLDKYGILASDSDEILDELEEVRNELKNNKELSEVERKEYEERLKELRAINGALKAQKARAEAIKFKNKLIDGIKKQANRKSGNVYQRENLKSLIDALGKKGEKVKDFLINGKSGMGALPDLEIYLTENGIIDDDYNVIRNLRNLSDIELRDLSLVVRTVSDKMIQDQEEFENQKKLGVVQLLRECFHPEKMKFTDSENDKIAELVESGVSEDDAKFQVSLSHMDRAIGTLSDKEKTNSIFKSKLNNLLVTQFMTVDRILKRTGFDKLILGDIDDKGKDRIYGLYQYNRDRLAEIQKANKGMNEAMKQAFNISKDSELKKAYDSLNDKFGKLGKVDNWQNYFSEDEYDNAEAISNTESTGDYTLNDLIGIYIYAKDSKALRMLMSEHHGNGISKEQIAWVRREFEEGQFKNLKVVADYMLKDMGSRYKQIAEVLQRTSNIIMKERPNYFPYQGSGYIVDLEMIDPSSYENYNNANLPDFFTKKVTNAEYPLRLNVVNSYAENVEMQSNYIYGAEMFQKFNMMMKGVNGISLYNILESRYGKPVADTISNYLKYNQNVRTLKTELTSTVDKLRANYMTAKLAWNLSTVFQQVSSLYLGLQRYSGLKLASTLVKGVKNPNLLHEQVVTLSSQMASRTPQDLAYIREVGSNANKYGEAGKLYKRFVESGLKAMEVTDRVIAETLWMTAYEDNMAKGMTSEEAVKDADMWVLSIQSTKNPMYNSMAYNTDNSYVKYITMFTNQLNKQFNMFTDIFLDSSFKNITGTLAGLALSTMWVVLVTGKFIPEDDENAMEAWLKAIGSESLGYIPYAGKFIKGVAEGYAYQQSDDIFSTGAALVKTILEEDKGKKEQKIKTASKNFAGSLLDLASLPSVAGKRIYQAEQLLSDGYGLYSVAPFFGSAWREYVENYY